MGLPVYPATHTDIFQAPEKALLEKMNRLPTRMLKNNIYIYINHNLQAVQRKGQWKG